MSTLLIVVILLALAGGVAYLATRKKPPQSRSDVLPQDPDTAWNDPLTPGQPARTDLPPRDGRDEPRA